MSEQKDDKTAFSPEKAVDEAATKLVSKVFDQAGDGTMSVVGDIFGGLIGDPIREWRTRNTVRLAEKTASYVLKKTGSLENMNRLPRGELYSLFEEASKYDEEELQNIWARLLASSLTEKEYIGRLRPLIAIARQLDSFDAKLLKAIFEYEKIHEAQNLSLDMAFSAKAKEREAESEEFMLRFRAKERVAKTEIEDELAELAASGASEKAINEKRRELERALRNRIDPSRFEFERQQTTESRKYIDKMTSAAQSEADLKVVDLWQKYHDAEGEYEEASLHNLLRLGCILVSSAANFHPGAETDFRPKSTLVAHLVEVERLNDAKPALGRLFARFGKTRRTNYVLTNLGYRFATATCDGDK